MSAGMDKSPENNPVDGQNAHGCHTLTIWADADSLPKDIRPFLIKRAWTRRDYEDIRVLVQFVAARAPADIPREFLVLVEPGEGAADRYIEAHAAPYDIVVTRDIPFAERLVGRSVHAMNDRGDTFTTENIAERRSLRDAMVSLRSAGLAPPSPKNSQRTQTETKHFADALERLVVRAVRGKKRNDQD
ncbi:MAG: DUF188 domain-containing protein [Rectinema sp.]|jgi:uncharacterized protein YaiI (UPF0178 family)